MKAVVRHSYGAPHDVLELQDVAMPELAEDDQVLVRVHATSVNPAEWHPVIGKPYMMRPMEGMRRPKSSALGTDVAGTVEAVGSAVTRFQPGDEVFGGVRAAFAEYAVGRERGLVAKPANVTFEQAAAVPIAAVTALQGLRDKGGLEAGQRVLINGASGGVGTFAVQVAKALGAEVTAVCSTRNVDTVRSIGADHVVDYTKDDFTRGGETYDVILDNVGNRSVTACRRLLEPEGTYVMISGPKGGLLGPLPRIARGKLMFAFGSRKMVFFVAGVTQERLAYLAELLESGRMTPVVERTYGLKQLPDALAYLGEGHAQGKIVVTV